MTPQARVAAAIEILDQVLDGTPAEKALTKWARGSRYAGSKDRAAVRDHVFDALRNKLSYARRGHSLTGRGLMIGALRAAKADPAEYFTGETHAPAPLDAVEAQPGGLMDVHTALDCPYWLAPQLQESLQDDFAPVMRKLKSRAPVFLRVNLLKTTREKAIGALSEEAIATRPHRLSPTALEITENPRRLRQSVAYKTGLVELQDAASQAICDRISLPADPGAGPVLDYCAGGGGKALALCARGAQVVAHDTSAARLKDLPARAARAGVEIPVLTRAQVGAGAPYPLVVADVPCSGSGAWRRAPEGKWRLSPEVLDKLHAIQARILDEISDLAAPGGQLVYITCSLLNSENQDQIAGFLERHSGWKLASQTRLTPLDGGDGFYMAHLKRE